MGVTPKTQLLSVPVGDLYPDPTQPRKTFIGEEIQRLADSIAARGVLTPLRVMRAEDRQGWLIVTGESRWRAAKLAGLETVPCIVVESADEADLLSDRIVENHVRCDLSPIELGRAIVKLKRLRGCTAQTLTKETGISGAELSKTESLLSLPDSIQAKVEDGSLPVSIAYEISRLKEDEPAQHDLALAVVSGKMNRKAVNEAVATKVGSEQVKPKDSHLSCRIDGVAVSMAAETPLTLDTLIAVLRHLIREASAAGKVGQSVADLAIRLKVS